AHQGVLFLDELPEFERKVLEVLREPLESGEIVIARANGRVRFPARFQLVAAMNPCPCGYLGDPSGRCRCTPEQVQRYRGKLSGPLLDRIDLHVSVLRESTSLQPGHGETATAEVSERVGAARQRQLARQGCANAHLDLQAMHRNCALAEADRRWLEAAGERLELSLRALHRILKVARTLADLERIDAIERRHLAEALQYRAMTST
ncbi:TPA: ATP-binding protein, partial [Pseudomonas aeruginosa]|nr:ATP-binding protein [Pseudomonas aeruginosa]